MKNTFYGKVGKALLDKIIAIAAFIILLPVFLVTVWLLLVFNQGMIFFLQPRPGKNQVIFKVIKFKTMNNKVDENGELLPDAKRITRIGSFIRKTSLDEMPQLLNVIKGDMSLVGPRPLLIEYLPLYNDKQKRRHDVKPGITGMAQVNGRNTINWEEKFDYDIWYVNNLSFFLDVKIMWLTIAKVFRSEGISQQGSATMEKFKGNIL